jgi:Leucine-rich repeat (LRR) protein
MVETTITRRSWFCFRLRTLLIGVALVAIPLAWIAKERRQSRYEVQLADHLREGEYNSFTLGGPYDSMVLAAEDKPQGWWRDVARQAMGQRVLTLRHEFDDEFTDLTALAALTHLQELSLARSAVHDLTPLAKLTSIRWLYLNNTKVINLTPIAGLINLHELKIYNCQVTDLKPLARLVELERLDLDFTPVIDLAPLARLTHLQYLTLNGTPVNDLTPLAGLVKLEGLWLNQTQVHDLAPLARLTSLTDVTVQGSRVTKEQVEALQKALPNCKIWHDPFP